MFRNLILFYDFENVVNGTQSDQVFLVRLR